MPAERSEDVWERLRRAHAELLALPLAALGIEDDRCWASWLADHPELDDLTEVDDAR